MRAAVTIDVEHPDQRRHGGPDQIAAILDALAVSDIRATFFLQGAWLSANPEMGAAIGAAGHLVGNHSYHHVDAHLLSGEGMQKDVMRAHQEIEKILGIDARPWYRLPYGAGDSSRAIRRQLSALGYRHVGWDVDVRDFEAQDDEVVLRAMERELSAREDAGATHATVLLHSWPLVTASVMPRLCMLLRRRCEALVTVDEVPGNGASPVRPGTHDRVAQLLGGVRGAFRRFDGR